MDKDFRLTNEVKRVLRESEESAICLNLHNISAINFISHFFDVYADERGENKVLQKYLLKIGSLNLSKMAGEIKEMFTRSFDKSVKDKLPDWAIAERSIIFSTDLSELFEDSRQLTKIRFPERFNKIDSDVIMLSMLSSRGSIIQKILNKYGFTKGEFEDMLINNRFSEKEDILSMFKEMLGDRAVDLFGDTKKKSIDMDPIKDSEKMNNENEEDFEKYGENKSINPKEVDPNSSTPELDRFSTDMTKYAELGKYDPVVGRDIEIDQIIGILCKRKKNNPILLGDPGCGKTAIVECLAQKIVNKEVPDKLLGKRICSLNLNDLVAGTKYRGEYEERLQKIIKEVCNDDSIIVFIDEIHNLVGSGGSAGSGDGANILKPYLARGEFQCISSTTTEEYRKIIEKDGALKRRFNEIQVKVPTAEETERILRVVAKSYEKFHKVLFNKEVISACVELSGRYITDRFFPDKAIDVLDMVGSIVSLRHVKDEGELPKLREELNVILQEKAKAVMEENDYAKGTELRNKADELKEKIELEEKKLGSLDSKRKNWEEATLDDVYSIISKLSRVPVDKIRETDREMLVKMKTELTNNVIGQKEAVDISVQCLQRNYLGMRDESKPIASLLLVGPSGTGKTWLAKNIARIFFGSEKALVKFDMSQLTSEADVSQLLGASPGYIGYDNEAGFNKVRRTNGGHVVCLLDEIEKANPKVFDIFMNILDEGYCTTGDGTRIDFTNSIIIFTGNIGTKELAINGSGIGFNPKSVEDKKKMSTDIVMKAVSKTFRPEFINRLTKTVVFNELTKDDLKKIFSLEFENLKKLYKKNKINVKVDLELRDHIIGLCDTKFGARDLKRNMETFISDPVGNAMLEDLGHSSFSVHFDKDTNKSLVTAE